MGLVKWFKKTFLSNDDEKKKKKKTSVTKVEKKESSSSSKARDAYKKSETSKRATTSISNSRSAENNIWNRKLKDSVQTKKATDNKKSMADSSISTTKTNTGYKSLADYNSNSAVQKKLQEKIKQAQKDKEKQKETRVNAIKNAEGNSTPTALRGTGETATSKKIKSSTEKYQKYMGDDAKSRAEAHRDAMTGGIERTRKDVKYAQENQGKRLYFSKRFADGVTLGASKILEKKADTEVKKTLDKNAKEVGEQRFKIEAKDLNDTDKRLNATSVKGLSGKETKGVSGETLGTVAEMAGNMATYGATAKLTKGVGEKSLNKIAKLAKAGETSEEALAKSRIVQKLAKGNTDKAKKIAEGLASGLAEDAGINLTTGAVQAGIDAKLTTEEDKNKSFAKEFAKNQAVNFALGGATEVGGAILRNRTAKREAKKAVDSFVAENKRQATKGNVSLKNADNAELKKLYPDLSDAKPNYNSKGTKKNPMGVNVQSYYKLTGKKNKKLPKYAISDDSAMVPYSAINDGTADEYKAFRNSADEVNKVNELKKAENAEKLNELDSKIAEYEKEYKKASASVKRVESRGQKVSDELDQRLTDTEYKLESYKAQKKKLDEELNKSTPTYDEWLNTKNAEQTADNVGAETPKADADGTFKQTAEDAETSNANTADSDGSQPKTAEEFMEDVERETYLRQRGAQNTSPDNMLAIAERTVTNDDAIAREAREAATTPTPDKIELTDFNKDSKIDSTIMELQDDYKQAIARDDVEGAKKIQEDFFKMYGARQSAQDEGIRLAKRQLEGGRIGSQDSDFRIPSAEDLRMRGITTDAKKTTVYESKKFAENVDKLNANRHDGLKTGKTTKTMYNNQLSDEGREITKELTDSGFLDTVKRRTKRDGKQAIEEVLADPTQAMRELVNYIDEKKGFYGKEFYTTMLKAEALHAYCSKHVAEDVGFQKGLAVAENYIAKYGGLTGNTMNAMSVFASCNPLRKRLLIESNLKELFDSKGKLDVYNELMGTVEEPGQFRKILDDFEHANSDSERQVLSAMLWRHANRISGNRGMTDLLNTWRYLAMLSSPKTHVRNLLGNVVSMGTRSISDVLTSHMQDKLLKAGVIDEKTVGKLTAQDKMNLFRNVNSSEAKYSAMNKYIDEDVFNMMGTTDKYGDFNKLYNKDDKLLVKAVYKSSDKVGGLLESGDRIFVKANYKKRFFQYMNANDYNKYYDVYETALKKRDELQKQYDYLKEEGSAVFDYSAWDEFKANRDSVREKLKKATSDLKKASVKVGNLEKQARKYAKEEALSATYRDANALAETLNHLTAKAKKENARTVDKVIAGFINAELPFTSTPANVAKQAIRFSPIGLGNGAARISKAMKIGDVYAINKATEELSAGLTGTGIALLGFFLGRNNALPLHLNGKVGDNDEGYYKQSLGIQDYSIEFGSGDNRWTATLDWLSPTASTLFIGAKAGEIFDNWGAYTDYGGTIWDNADELMSLGSTAIEPLLEMSMLQTLSNTFENASSDSDKNPLINVAKSAVQSYVGSFVPNVARGVAKTIRPYDYNTLTHSTTDGGKQSERWFANLKNGLRIDDAGDAKTDVWGNVSGQKKSGADYVKSAFNNLINPSTMKKITMDETDEANLKLYKRLSATNTDSAKSVLPQTWYKDTINIRGTETKLDATDVSLINQSRATSEGAKEALNTLFETKAFNKEAVRLSDDEKNKLINKNWKNTKEVVEWLHGTKAWKKASASEQASMQKAVLGQSGTTKVKGNRVSGVIDVYERDGKSGYKFYYDNEVSSDKKEKLKELASSKNGEKKIIDFMDGAAKISYSGSSSKYDGTMHKNYNLSNMYAYLNNAVSKGELTEDEASLLFDTFKSSNSKRTYTYGGGVYRAYRKGYSSYRRSGGGSSSGAGTVHQIKTSAFNTTVSDSDYKSMASSSSSSSKKKSTKIKSQITSANIAPTVKDAETFVKTKKK